MTSTNNAEAGYLKNFEDLMFGQRIAYVIETKGISKAWIAEKLGISKQALNYLLKHSIKPKFVDEFAELLELDPKWIETGVGVPFTKSTSIQPTVGVNLPISTQSDLLGRASASDQIKKTIHFSHPNAETFTAYKLEDDSNFPPFIEGSILIFNTEKSPVHEDYVLLTIGDEVFVRQYLIDGNDRCYKASNALHKTFINPTATVLGVLFEVRYQVS